MDNSGQGLMALGFVVSHYMEARHDPALHLVDDDLTSELDRRAGLTPLDDARLRFKQAEHFLARRHRLPFQHPPLRLMDGLLDQGEEALELRSEAAGAPLPGVLRPGDLLLLLRVRSPDAPSGLEGRSHPMGLSHRLARDLEQMWIE